MAALSGAVQGMAYGRHCYKGPKPPFKAIHNYTFTVFALSDFMDLPAASVKKDVLNRGEGLKLEKPALRGRFRGTGKSKDKLDGNIRLL